MSFGVLCDCNVYGMFLSDTAMPPPSTQFTLRVPLFAPTTNHANVTPVGVCTTVIAESETKPETPVSVRTAVIAESGMESTTPETTGPFNITDTEIDEMLRVLERGNIGGVLSQPSVEDIWDQDLKDVLSMDVGNFIV